MRRAAVLAALSVSAACGSKERAPAGDSAAASAPAASAPASSSADADLADVGRFRLSMDRVDKYYAAQRSLAAKVKAMSPAEREAAARLGHLDANASVDDMVRNVEQQPVVMAAVRDAGLSAREYTMITVAMFQSAMAAAVTKMRPGVNEDSLAREMKANPENVKFVREHEAELTRKQKDMEAEMKRLGVSDDSSAS